MHLHLLHRNSWRKRPPDSFHTCATEKIFESPRRPRLPFPSLLRLILVARGPSTLITGSPRPTRIFTITSSWSLSAFELRCTSRGGIWKKSPRLTTTACAHRAVFQPQSTSNQKPVQVSLSMMVPARHRPTRDPCP